VAAEAIEAAGLVFPAGAVKMLGDRIESERGIGRTQLSRWACEELGFHDALGRRREMSCRVALLELERRGVLELPQRQSGVRKSLRRQGGGLRIEPKAVKGSLAALGKIELVAITAADDDDGELSKLWNDLVAAHHYLGYTPLVGAQMRYLVRSEHQGWVGALGFAAAARRLRPRENFIGWSESERRAALKLVVNNVRFLMVARVQNLASNVLAKAARQLPRDWQERYGYTPVLLETFVDAEQFDGACYRAANWIEVGESSGRGRQDRTHAGKVSKKKIFVFPLIDRWRAALGVRTTLTAAQSTEAWAEREFGSCKLGDPRRTRRLIRVARDFYARPQATVPRACNGDTARVKATYRLMNNEDLSLKKLLEAPCRQTVTRMRDHTVVLAVQDTTSLNYTAHGKTEGIGPIATRTSRAVGLILHDTLAFTPDGLALGVLDAQAWVRDWEEKSPTRDIEQKESVKWLRSYQAAAAAKAELKNTTVVSVGDREADIYELFAMAVEREDGPELLVRASGDRCLEQEQHRLWAHLSSQPVAGHRELVVPPRPARNGKPARPARTVQLEVRLAPVTLRAPDGKRRLGKLALHAVLARETDPLDPDDPIEWMLLTTLEVKNFAQACEKLDWYTTRWMIEVYHRTLKSGCRIEERQHHTALALENCLAIDMVIAARILHLTWIGRTCPDIPCTVYFENNQWKAMYCFLNKTPKSPKHVPSIREFIGWVARLGGHLGRKCDAEPGTKSLWLGLPRMDDISEMYAVFSKFAEGP
jgi:hypothetical protein